MILRRARAALAALPPRRSPRDSGRRGVGKSAPHTPHVRRQPRGCVRPSILSSSRRRRRLSSLRQPLYCTLSPLLRVAARGAVRALRRGCGAGVAHRRRRSRRGRGAGRRRLLLLLRAALLAPGSASFSARRGVRCSAVVASRGEREGACRYYSVSRYRKRLQLCWLFKFGCYGCLKHLLVY